MERDQQFGPYQLVRKIASGGMAEIYLARTGGIQGFEKYLVLKMIHPKWSQDKKFISMLVEEAKLAVTLNHANIAQIFDLGQQGDVYYIAMEYVDGKDLFQVLVRTSEQDSYVPFEVATYVTEQVAAALHYAHTRCDARGESLRLIHRDVSPQNIIISYNGEVKLIDFGIAKATMRPGETQVGIIKGKFYYMSPEQAWGQPLDHRSDIFSLGICLHEMLTGQMLYAEDDQLLLLEKVRAAQIPRPSQLRPGVPPELDRITMKALARDPAQRFQSGYELQRALSEYLHRSSPGFTSNRVGQAMQRFFPQNQPGESIQGDKKLTGKEFNTQRPPDSVIFDLKKVGAPVGGPAGGHQAGRRGPTRSVDVSGAQAAQPRRNGAQEDGVLFGDSLSAGYKPGNGAHPPPPLGGAGGGANNAPSDSTRIVDWGAFKERHPQRSGHLLEETTNMRRDSKGILRPAQGSGVKPIQDDSTMMFTADDFNKQKQASGLRPMKAPVSRPGAGGAAPHERTTMFDPTQAPLPGAPAAAGPSDAMPHERTTMFDPSRMGSLQGAPPSSAGPTEALPTDAMPHERTTMFDPSKMGSLQGAPPAPAGPSDAMPHERTTMFDPSTMLPPEGAAPAPSPAPKKPARPMRAAPPKKAGDEGAGEAKKPMTREEKIAAAKARAKGGDSDLASKIKKKGDEDSGAEAKKPMTREEKIAAAKARAKGGGGDLASKIKKKPDGEGGGLSREEKIAAAKARAKGGGAGGEDLASKIKKKPKAEGDAGGADDEKAERIKAARAKARAKSGKDETPNKPNVVRGGSKGNAKSNMKVGKPTILGFNAYSVIAGLLAMVFLFLVIAGGVAWQFFKPEAKVEAGTIAVNSTPQGAIISFDGVDLGATTPYVIDAVNIEGLHSVRVQLEGYVQQEQLDIKVQPGAETKVDFVLKPIPGELVISSEPPEAEVLVLDEKSGEQKIRCTTPCTIDDLEHIPEAFVQLTLRKEGFKDQPVALKWPKEPKLNHHAKLEPVEEEGGDEEP